MSMRQQLMELITDPEMLYYHMQLVGPGNSLTDSPGWDILRLNILEYGLINSTIDDTTVESLSKDIAALNELQFDLLSLTVVSPAWTELIHDERDGTRFS